jgi:hypothetical protein
LIVRKIIGRLEAKLVRLAKTVEPTWKISVAGRPGGGFNGVLVVGYGMVNILEVTSIFKAT